jgi:hypothetical protein
VAATVIEPTVRAERHRYVVIIDEWHPARAVLGNAMAPRP